MTSLPSGLASISSRLDDSPQVRGAVAFGRVVRAQEERRKNEMFRAALNALMAEPEQEAIDRHAALVIGSAYKGRDRR